MIPKAANPLAIHLDANHAEYSIACDWDMYSRTKPNTSQHYPFIAIFRVIPGKSESQTDTALDLVLQRIAPVFPACFEDIEGVAHARHQALKSN